LGTGNSEAKIKQIKILQIFWPVFSAESSEANVKQLKFAEILASFQYRKLRRKSETI
jgi:hypothetical protein